MGSIMLNLLNKMYDKDKWEADNPILELGELGF